MFHFSTPWKCQITYFRGYRNETMIGNGLGWFSVFSEGKFVIVINIATMVYPTGDLMIMYTVNKVEFRTFSNI